MKNVVTVLVLVVIMSSTGRSQTPIVCLESIQKDDIYMLCISPKSIEQAFQNAQVESYKITESEDGYIKYCFLKVTDNGKFSQIMLISRPMRDITGRAECVYMEFFYENKILYLPEKNEKIWWQATNLLNNAEIAVLE